jgi:hypothetical protein
MNKKILKWIIPLIVVVGFGFYWFEWRPSQIRHDCSFVAHHTDAKPAYVPDPNQPIISSDTSKWGIDENGKFDYHKYLESERLYSMQNSNAVPAMSAKDWITEATPKEYEACLHRNGL